MIFVSKGKPVAELLEEIVAVKKQDHEAAKAGFSLSYAKKLFSVLNAATPPKIEGLIVPDLIEAGVAEADIPKAQDNFNLTN